MDLSHIDLTIVHSDFITKHAINTIAFSSVSKKKLIDMFRALRNELLENKYDYTYDYQISITTQQIHFELLYNYTEMMCIYLFLAPLRTMQKVTCYGEAFYYEAYQRV